MVFSVVLMFIAMSIHFGLFLSSNLNPDDSYLSQVMETVFLLNFALQTMALVSFLVQCFRGVA